MAEIIDTSSHNRSNDKWRHVGCIELSGDMNRMLRSEKIINIKGRLEQKGWVNVNDFDQGQDQHVFVFELPESNMSLYPEKPGQDWEESIDGQESIYLQMDGEFSNQ